MYSKSFLVVVVVVVVSDFCSLVLILFFFEFSIVSVIGCLLFLVSFVLLGLFNILLFLSVLFFVVAALFFAASLLFEVVMDALISVDPGVELLSAFCSVLMALSCFLKRSMTFFTANSVTMFIF